MNVRALVAMILLASAFAGCDRSEAEELWRLGGSESSIIEPRSDGVIGLDKSDRDRPRLVMLDPSTGQERWKAPPWATFVIPGESLDPLYLIRRARTGSEADEKPAMYWGSVLHLDSETGEVKSEVALEAEDACAPRSRARFRAAGDRIYFWQNSRAIDEGCHRAFGSIDPKTGVVEWSFPVQRGQLATYPLVLSDRVLFQGPGLEAVALTEEHERLFRLRKHCCGLAVTPDEKYMYHGANTDSLVVSTPDGEPIGRYEGRLAAISDEYLAIEAGEFDPRSTKTTLQFFRHGSFDPVFEYQYKGRFSGYAFSGEYLVFFTSRGGMIKLVDVGNKTVEKLVDVETDLIMSPRATGLKTRLDAKPVWQPPYLFLRSKGEEIAYRVGSTVE